EAIAVLKAMASHNRLLLLCELVSGERSVGELAQSLDLAQSTVSQHLSLLRRDGVVSGRREAQTIHYSISDPRVRALMSTLFEQFCSDDCRPLRPGIPMPHLLTLQALLAVVCGSAVGFSLALIGGGGSILAVPLLLYVVGLHDPHLAIGTSALVVSFNAFANLIPHARAGHVRWKVAFTFAAAGVLGAFVGSTIGKAINGHHLLVLFALLMLVVAGFMLRGRRGGSDRYPLPGMYPRLGAVGLGTGSLAGFFGIGGGFLIVPGLMFASGMEIIHAIGTSLFAVGAFGLTAA